MGVWTWDNLNNTYLFAPYPGEGGGGISIVVDRECRTHSALQWSEEEGIKFSSQLMSNSSCECQSWHGCTAALNTDTGSLDNTC